MPRMADITIIIIGDSFLFFDRLKIKFITANIISITIAHISAEKLDWALITPNNELKAIVTAADKIIATTQGLIPERTAFTPAYFKRLSKAAAIIRIIMNAGKTTPSVAINEPSIPH